MKAKDIKEAEVYNMDEKGFLTGFVRLGQATNWHVLRYTGYALNSSRE